MTWSHFDDAAPQHPKAVIAGNEAWGLWAAAVMYCNRYLTDGFVSDRALPTVLPCPISHAKSQKLAKVLCEARVTDDGPGLFERDDERGGWLVHDFLAWNPSKEQVEAKRKRDRERKDSARNPGGVRADKTRTQRGHHTDSASPTRAPAPAPAPDPSPAQPSPAQPLPQGGGGRVRCPRDLSLAPGQVAQAEQQGISPEAVEALTARFRGSWCDRAGETRTLDQWRASLNTAVHRDGRDETLRLSRARRRDRDDAEIPQELVG